MTSPAPAIAPGTLARAKERWERLRTLKIHQITQTDLFENPVLLRRDVVTRLQEDGSTGGSLDSDLMALLVELHGQFDDIRTGPSYPLGPGPVERIWDQVDKGLLAQDAAAAAVRSLPVSEGLTPKYAEALMRACWKLTSDLTEWRRMRDRAELAIAAIEASPLAHDARMTEAADLGWILCAHAQLCAVPDRRVLERAKAAGQRLLEQAADDPVERARLHARIAAVWSDPYTYGKDRASWQAGHQIWELAGHSELTARDGRPHNDWAMPPIEDALVASIEHWRSAYPIHPILAVGGWSDAELFLAQVRGSQVPDDVGAAVVKAITELGRPSEGPLTDSERWRLRGQLLRNAKALRLPLEHPGTAGIEATDLDDLAAQFGRQTPRIVNDYVVSLSDYDPAASLAVLEHFSTVFADPAVTGYQDLVSVAANYVQINYKAHVSSEVPIKPDSQTFDEFASAYVNEAKTPFLVATRALRLACLSGDYDAEDSGLSLLALASQEAPLFAARIKPHIKALAVVLHTGEAVNRYSASDVSGAAANYMRAVQYCVSLKQQEILAELLVRLDDVVIESDEKTVIDVAVRLALVAPDVLRMVGPDADAWLAQILGDALGSLVKKESVKLAALWTVLLLRAGLRTSLVLSNATVPQIDRDEECRELLAKLKGVPDQLSDRAKSMRTAVQDRYRALSLEGAIHALPVLSLDQVRRVVDGSTVLLVTATAFSRTEQGRLALLVWDDGATAAWGGWKPIQDEVDLVSPALIYQLQQLMARGKRHLCVFADGGLQTIPWHRLLIDEDMLLGDRWLVTLLPHPSVLMRGRRGGWVPRTPTYPVVAFGVQNAGPDWEPLEDAVDEASAIADFLGGRAVPDADATKAAFRELSEQCRYLHIATHGVFHADHPAFHAVLLSPSDEDDGILHAYEVANLDLSAVELVTLSACETAQLTVSAGDNVDGLPLAFLTAGARAVVGTQIEVETGQSRFFFEALYRELALDPDLRPAFVAARDATRATFPESDAWASFYLLGGWT